MARSNDPISTFDPNRIASSLGIKLSGLSSRREKTNLVAAHLFFDLGVFPSASAVRSVTSQGSLTDINQDLRVFWQELRLQSSPSHFLPALPEPLGKAFGAAINVLWSTALQEANATLSALQAETKNLVDAANVRAADSLSKLDQAKEQIATLTNQLAEGRAAQLDVERELAQAQHRSAAQAESILESEKLLQTAQAARTELQALLADGLDGLRKSSDRASDAFRGEVNFLKMQVDGARSAERELREQLQASRQNRDLELQVLRQQNNSLLEVNGRLALTNQELVQRLAELSPSRPDR